jgi:NADPH:quinone reductase-like Zn-dependent oxidoreductase
MKGDVVPGSDGAGTVVAIGEKVTRFQKGDRVCTTVNQAHLAGSLTPAASLTGLGGSLDGVLRSYGVFPESGLVSTPSKLSFREASTLPCAAVTAWNALYGLAGRSPKPGDTVLTLGSGGVSLFAIQLAAAAGATVISTTSSTAKGERLKALGSSHIIDYNKDKSWGQTAKSLSAGGEGVDFIIEVGGPSTLSQSVAAIKADGIIAVAGSIGSDLSAQGDPGLLSAWTSNCIVRGIAVGSRALLEEAIRAIEAKGIQPVVDDKRFTLDQLKEAYSHMLSQRNFGKVVIDIQ